MFPSIRFGVLWLFWITLLEGSQSAQSGLYGFSPFTAFTFINTTDASFTEISEPLPPMSLQFQGVSTADVNNRIFYVLDYEFDDNATHLYGVGVDDGAVTSFTTLPLSESMVGVGVGNGMAYDPVTGLCFVMGYLSGNPTRNHYVLAVNISTGEFKQVVLFEANTALIAAPTTFDYRNRFYITIFGDDTAQGELLFLGGVETGQVKTVPLPQLFQSLAYNGNDGYVYAFGLQGNTRTLVRFDPSSFAIDQIGALNDYYVIYGGLSALDAKNRILYGLLQPRNTGTYELVGVNLDTATVVSHPVACEGVYVDPNSTWKNNSIFWPMPMDVPYCLFQLQFY